MNICPECNHPMDAHKADYGCTALLMGSYPARPCGCSIEPGDYRPCGHPAAYIHHDQDGTAFCLACELAAVTAERDELRARLDALSKTPRTNRD